MGSMYDTSDPFAGAMSGFEKGYGMRRQSALDEQHAKDKAAALARQQAMDSEHARHNAATEESNDVIRRAALGIRGGKLDVDRKRLAMDQGTAETKRATAVSSPYLRTMLDLAPEADRYASPQVSEMGSISRSIASEPTEPTMVFPGMDVRTGQDLPGQVTQGPSPRAEADQRFTQLHGEIGPLVTAGREKETKLRAEQAHRAGRDPIAAAALQDLHQAQAMMASLESESRGKNALGAAIYQGDPTLQAGVIAQQKTQREGLQRRMEQAMTLLRARGYGDMGMGPGAPAGDPNRKAIGGVNYVRDPSGQWFPESEDDAQ